MSRAALISQLQQDLESFPQIADATNYVNFTESSNAPEIASQIRHQLLLTVYGADYPTDTYDFERVSRRAAELYELIWFWGDSENVARLRDAFHTRCVDNEPYRLGTSTLIPAESEFGLGHGELCRFGSTVRNSGAKGAHMKRLLDFMTCKSPHVGDRFHSIISTTRNRVGTSTIRGGEAAHHITTRYARSRFWGFTPWYVMPGGALELLELRECNRDPDDVVRALAQDDCWYFADSREAEFARALVALSFGIHIQTEITDGSGASTFDSTFQLLSPSSTRLMEYSHASIVPSDAEGEGTGFEAALDHLEALGVACNVVYLPLTNPASVRLQSQLRQKGFALGAIVPPKDTWIEVKGTRKAVRSVAMGIWNRPRLDLRIVPPYYLHSKTLDGPERVVLDYAKRCILGDSV